MPHRPAVLIVEDHRAVCEMIAEALGDRYNVSSAPSLRQARARLADRRTRLLLLDCLLPDGHGLDLAAEAERAGIPVLLMTGDPGMMGRLGALGRPYLLKPFKLAALTAAVAALLGTALPSPAPA